MRFYLVDEHRPYEAPVVVGYFHYHTFAWQEFQKSSNRRLVEFELVDNKSYEPVNIWEHEPEQVNL
jgi:hypothetical protein